MCLAASQARLLLLTARKSDLEFRAQQITNAEMMLAMQTEDIARQYSIKMSNQTVMKLDGNSERVNFTYETLIAMGYEVNFKNKSDDPLDGEGIYLWVSEDDQKGIDTNQYNELSAEAKEKYHLKIKTNGKNYSAKELLQMYREGLIEIIKPHVEEEEGEKLSFDSDTGFAVCYDTSDDRQAEAEYQQATAAIQVKEKRLQMELIQIETQQKACETEMESVKKVIDKNADKTFKYFS